MWAFQYKHGDRPLEGYTIQRAAGRGGFGEVYYAVSDSGREVALKVVQGYEQIELRGITQCMNLKSPHLVAIFDVKFNEQGKPFVIMEFVSGPNLRQLLDESPAGLGTQKAAFFLREIAKGLQYLHDCGIVHRDLKPGNIFFENGIVKIGDYGLSKSISTSQHSAQTVTVGTVHYMAPEIGAGKYDRSIDIYALGAVLYEMLTGVPPFVGASPTEVLMKHLQAEPDMTGIEEPFRSAIRRAMAKDPAQRFKSVQEMVEAVFGAEHVQMSVSQFSPHELSMVAGRVAAKINVGVVPPGSFSPSTGAVPPQPPKRNLLDSSCLEECDDEDERMALAGWTESAEDKLPLGARVMLAAVSGLAISVAVGLFWNRGGEPIIPAIIVALSAGSAAASLLLFGRWLGQFVRDESPWVQRLAVAGPAALAVNLLSLPLYFSEGSFERFARPTILIIAAALLLADARTWISPTRRSRATIGPAFFSGIAAFVLCMIFDGSVMISLGVIAATAVMVQLIAPWRRPSERLQVVEKYAIGGLGIKTTIEPAATAPAAPVNRVAAFDPAAAVSPVAPAPAFTASIYRPVPRFAPLAWLGGFVALLAVGIPLCVVAANAPYHTYIEQLQIGGRVMQLTRHDMTGEAIALTVIGVSCLVSSVFFLLQSFRKRFRGWWPYVIRPAIRLVCVLTIVASGIILGNANLSAAGTAVLTSKIVLASLVFILLTFVPARWWDPTARATRPAAVPTHIAPEPGISHRKRLWALILAGVGLVTPVAGLHRLYVGKIGTGILYLITWGWFGIGSIIDVIVIACGGFRDFEGRRVLRWEDEPLKREDLAAAANEAAPATPQWMNQVVSSVTSAIDGTGATGRRLRAQFASARATAFDGASRTARAATGGIASALAGLFIFAATLVALALAVDVPGMIDAGRPNPRVRAEVLDFLQTIDFIQRDTPRSGAASLGGSRIVVRTEMRHGSTQGQGPETLAGALDRFAANMQEQFKNLDQDLAQSVIRMTREAQSGNLQVSRVAIEMQALNKALGAAQSGIKALEEARVSLARLERERAQSATGGVQVEPVPPTTPPAAVRPGAGARDLDIETSDAALRRALRDLPAFPELAGTGEVAVAAPLRLLGLVAWGILTICGLTLLMFARRRNGATHLVRGVAGVALLMLAMVPLNAAVGQRGIWERTAGQSVRAVADELTRGLTSPAALTAGGVFLTAMLMLSWPPRRMTGPQLASESIPAPPPPPEPKAAPASAEAEGVKS